MSDTLERQGGTSISAFLVVEIIYIFHLTSAQPLQFHQFMSRLMQDLKTANESESHIYGHITTFIGDKCYNLVEKFVTDGFDNYSGRLHGVHPISVANLSSSLFSLIKFLQTAGASTCNYKDYWSLVQNIRREIFGLDTMKSQQLVFNCASLRLFLPIEFTQYFKPGSQQQLRQLKLEPYLFDRPGQVTQLIQNILLKRTDLLPIQCESLLNASLSCGGRQLIFRDHSPVFAAKDTETGMTVIHQFNVTSQEFETISVGDKPGFDYSTSDRDHHHYVPDWCIDLDATGYVLLPSKSDSENIPHYSKKNHDFISEFSNEIIDQRGSQCVIDRLPTFLKSGSYLIVPPKQFASGYLRCTEETLRQSMEISGSISSGFCVEFDTSSLRLSTQRLLDGGSMNHLPFCRVPSFKQIKTDRGNVSYETEEWAELAMYIHIIINFAVTEGREHWTWQYFRGKITGFFLLMSLPSCSSITIPFAYLFLDPKDVSKILCTLLDESGFTKKPFLVTRIISQHADDE